MVLFLQYAGLRVGEGLNEVGRSWRQQGDGCLRNWEKKLRVTNGGCELVGWMLALRSQGLKVVSRGGLPNARKCLLNFIES